MEAIDEHSAVSHSKGLGPCPRAQETAAAATSLLDATPIQPVTLTGVLYGRSVRSGYACLHMYCPPAVDDDATGSGGSIGSSSALDDDQDCWSLDGETVLIRLQFGSTLPRRDDDSSLSPLPSALVVQQLRSHVRRFCKPGDLLHICDGRANDDENNRTPWRGVGAHVRTSWQQKRLVLSVDSMEQAQQMILVQERRYWTAQQVQACQSWQGYGGGRRSSRADETGTDHHHGDGSAGRRSSPLVAPPRPCRPTKEVDDGSNPMSPHQRNHHIKTGLMKRTQGEYVKNFLAHMVLTKLLGQQSSSSSIDVESNQAITSHGEDASQWPLHRPQDPTHMDAVRRYLNRRSSGVVDVAGGAGHVSMALGLDGIQSTLVDPRDKVGKLPGRDRKVWHKACQKQSVRAAADAAPLDTALYCQPVQYHVYQAWFGEPPEVRHQSQTTLPVCWGSRGSADDGNEENDNDHDQVLQNCTAIVALHPDEATDAIVETAVRHRIPFLIVPCCVFYRLFTHRRMPHDASQPVSTYEDLLEYLQAKDSSIQRSQLPFAGANTILWSIF